MAHSKENIASMSNYVFCRVFTKIDHNVKKDIERVAKSVLNDVEYHFFGHKIELEGFGKLTQEQIGQEFGISANEVSKLEEITCYKIIKGFENQDKLEEKMGGQFIRCPDCSGLINYKDIEKYTVRPPEELMEMDLYKFFNEKTNIFVAQRRKTTNLRKLVTALYTGRFHYTYRGDRWEGRPIKKLKDLYTLTEKEIRSTSFRGVTWGKFNKILTENYLPVVGLPNRYEYTFIYQNRSEQKE